MAIRKIQGTIDVLTAAKIRIRNVWENAPKLYLSFSSGKDSLCVSNLVYDMILRGEIDPKKLTVIFIDEEGLYPSMVKAAETWREKFLRVGSDFRWYCLPFKQVCTLNSLSSEESWVTWEPGQEDVWMRTPPPYAIVKSDLLHYAGEMNYQSFCEKLLSDGISIIGLRTAESYTRMFSISQMDLNNPKKNNNRKFYPIYDWTDNDVWLYIKQNNLDFPEIYMRLYEAGVTKPQLRLSAFFGDKTVQGLRWIAETDPDLWERIEKRMPNAYLALLYWDSEMFARSTRKRRNLEKKDGEKKDYKALCRDILFENTDKYAINHDTKEQLYSWRRLFIECDGVAKEKHYKKIYESLLAGDPKRRSLRTIYGNIYMDFAKELEKYDERKS